MAHPQASRAAQLYLHSWGICCAATSAPTPTFVYLQQLLHTLYDARFRLPFAAAHAPLFVRVPGLCVYLLR